jgi:hypothetical protein
MFCCRLVVSSFKPELPLANCKSPLIRVLVGWEAFWAGIRAAKAEMLLSTN